MTSDVLMPDLRRPLVRAILLLAALGCFAAAALVVLAAGLPDRAEVSALSLRPDGTAVAPEVGAIAPPLDLYTPSGERFSLRDTRGRVAVVNFWATWCAPCRVEMPALQTLSETYPERLWVLGVNVGESADAVRRWRQTYALTFPLLLDPEGTAARDYRLRGQPTTIIVAPDGRIREIIYGPADIGALEQAVSALLPESTERVTP